ncbi:MAG TPA: hypothetical protein VEA40_00830 [Ramlibacter sp.]|nr:hypothetical protein [Ramlibacter sp.]
MKRRARKFRARRVVPSAVPVVSLERIVPDGALFLAAYVVAVEGGRHVGYAKVCPSRPPSVWETPDAFVKMASPPCADPQQALEHALAAARLRLALLAARDEGDILMDSEFIEL